MIEEMISKFSNQSGSNAFLRIDNTHMLDVYVGFDTNSNYSIMLISDIEPTKLVSSAIITIEAFQRKDLRWSTVMSLVQTQYLDLFYQVCYDLIESSRVHQSSITGQSFFFERYKKWQNLLKRNRKGLLSNQEIKGLIGELYFLKNILFKNLSYIDAIESWTGPEKLKQDFILEDIWFEIKSTTSSSSSVRISSIEQLDIKKSGYLVVLELDKTSSLDHEKITLNMMYEEICSLLDTEQIRVDFDNKLFDFGYINRKEYDNETYRFININYYIVNESFPRLSKEKIPSEIIEALYELSLSGIERYRIYKEIKKLGDLWN